MNIAIIGAGLAGRLLAWRLLEHGHTVSLYDRDNGDGAQSAGIIAAAMLAPYSEILDAEPIVYHQGIASIAIWQMWAQQLLQTTDIDINLQLKGSIVVAHRNDEGDFRHFQQRLMSHPIVNKENITTLDKQGLLALEPELATRFDKACYLAQEGCLDNVALFIALATRIQQLGGQWQTNRNIDKDNWLGAEFSDKDYVIDCRGFGAQKNLVELRGVRGEVIRVRAPEVNLTHPIRLMHPRYKLYIAPKPNHEYVIGATQIESSSEHGVTVRSSLELLSALYSVHSGFAEAEILSQTARCRPALNDNLPQIIFDEKYVSVNGLYRHGYLLSPAVITQMVQALESSNDNCWPDIVSKKYVQEGSAA